MVELLTPTGQGERGAERAGRRKHSQSARKKFGLFWFVLVGFSLFRVAWSRAHLDRGPRWARVRLSFPGSQLRYVKERAKALWPANRPGRRSRRSESESAGWDRSHVPHIYAERAGKWFGGKVLWESGLRLDCRQKGAEIARKKFGSIVVGD